MRILHLHSSFSPGGKELRAARLMNAFGPGPQHAIVSGVPGELGAASAIDPAVGVDYPDTFPALSGKPWPWRLYGLARAMRGFDLILSYNWGAMDAVAAHRLFGGVVGLGPLVHHEDGFNQDEIARLDPRRNRFRRAALARAAALVVPSQRLETIAREHWGVAPARIRRIDNGIDLAAFGDPCAADAVPGLIKRPQDRWLGTVAGLRPVKALPRLVRAFAAMPADWQLVIVGEGPERAAIADAARQLGLADRVHLPGFVAEPARIMGLFDVFALSSDSEQFPISVVEAMAAGLPVVSPAVGDIAAMVAPENGAWVVPAGDEAALGRALAETAAEPERRARAGAANHALALARYDAAGMIARYRAVYAGALGQAAFP